jgi:hypothetical protein
MYRHGCGVRIGWGNVSYILPLVSDLKDRWASACISEGVLSLIPCPCSMISKDRWASACILGVHAYEPNLNYWKQMSSNGTSLEIDDFYKVQGSNRFELFLTCRYILIKYRGGLAQNESCRSQDYTPREINRLEQYSAILRKSIPDLKNKTFTGNKRLW